MMVRFAKVALFILLASRVDGAEANEVRHQVRVIHPALIGTDKGDRTLVQVRGAGGRPDEFHMDVDSVSCNDDQCRVVPVRIHWNELGFYTRFELAAGVTLEKAEGKPFTQSDLAKLHRVLADRRSTLWQLRMDQYLQKPGEGVDAVSSPTIIMDKSRYVEGAVWTCCTLWNWANGGTRTHIRDITARGSSLKDLRKFLKNGDHDHREFALEQITIRKAYDPETLEVVLGRSSEEDHRSLKMIVGYVDGAPPAAYHACIGSLLRSDNRKLRLMCLDSLLRTKREAPPGFLAQVGTRICASNSYQEIDLFLKIAERGDGMTPDISHLVVQVLEHENFIIARRASWSLSELPLPKPDQDKLDRFRRTHADRL